MSIPGPIEGETAPDDGKAESAMQRQCGRCRRFFPADAGVDALELRDWWTCPPCREALFPAGTGASATARGEVSGRASV